LISVTGGSNTSFNVSITNNAGTDYLNHYNQGNISSNGAFKVILNSGTAYTSETMKLKTNVSINASTANGASGNSLIIYKYKTA
jgi:hypothetical protein